MSALSLSLIDKERLSDREIDRERERETTWKRSCDQLGCIFSTKNANFGWVLAVYFCPLVLGHPVQQFYDFLYDILHMYTV